MTVDIRKYKFYMLMKINKNEMQLHRLLKQTNKKVPGKVN